MRTDITGLANSNTTAIATWAQAISNAIRSLGFVRVSGSHAAVSGGPNDGASNFTGLTAVAANTEYAWEIWRFDDTLHAAGYPAYFRIGYGSGSVSGGGFSPAVWASCGTELNTTAAPFGGPGTNFVGNYSTTYQLVCGANAPVPDSFVSGGAALGRFLLCFSPFNGNSGNIIVGVERLHNADGSDNNEGLFLVVSQGASGSVNVHNNQAISHRTIGANGLEHTQVECVFQQSGNVVYGSDFHISKVYPHRGVLLNPSKNVMVGGNGTMADKSAQSFESYGVAVSWFMNWGPPWTSMIWTGSNGPSGVGFLLRYD